MKRTGYKKPEDMDVCDVEFLQAVDTYRRKINPFPSVLNYLEILKRLGWQKAGQENKK